MVNELLTGEQRSATLSVTGGPHLESAPASRDCRANLSSQLRANRSAKPCPVRAGQPLRARLWTDRTGDGLICPRVDVAGNEKGGRSPRRFDS